MLHTHNYQTTAHERLQISHHPAHLGRDGLSAACWLMVMAGSDSAAHYSGSASLVAAAPGPNSKSQGPATGSTRTGAAVLANTSRLTPDMRLLLVLLAGVSARVVRELPREGR